MRFLLPYIITLLLPAAAQAFTDYPEVKLFKISYPKNHSFFDGESLKIKLDLPSRCKDSTKEVWVGTEKDEPKKTPFQVLSQSESGTVIKLENLKLAAGEYRLKLTVAKCGTAKLRLHALHNIQRQLPLKIVDTFIKNNPAHKMGYGWTNAIFLYGLARYAGQLPANSSDRARYMKYLDDYFKAKIEDGLPAITSPDLAATALAATEFHRYSQNSDISAVLQATKKFFDQEPANELGALCHVGRKHRFYSWMPLTRRFVSDSIWVDSMVMYGLTGFRLAKDLKLPELLSFSRQQPGIFIKYLQAENGLFKHGYFLKSKELKPRHSYWARGNGWAAMSLIDYLDEDRSLLDAIGNPLKALLKALRENLNGSIKVSTTLLNSQSDFNYPEVSGAALSAYALAKAQRLGIGNGDSLKLAQEVGHDLAGYVTEASEGQTVLTQISGPTDAFNPDYYYTLIVRPGTNWSYGVGAYLLLMGELSRSYSSEQN